MNKIEETSKEWWFRIFLDHGFLRAIYPNIWKIDDNMFRSAQPSPSLLLQFKNQGIKTIINLRGPRNSPIDEMERRVCKNLNLNLVEFKMYSRQAPSKNQIFEADDLFQKIEYPALMHCKSGADRTGIMATLYLVNKGLNLLEAKKQLSIKFLHIRYAKSGILDAFVETYISYKDKGGKLGFKNWVIKIYDLSMLKKKFQVNFLRKVLDYIINRE